MRHILPSLSAHISNPMHSSTNTEPRISWHLYATILVFRKLVPSEADFVEHPSSRIQVGIKTLASCVVVPLGRNTAEYCACEEERMFAHGEQEFQKIR